MNVTLGKIYSDFHAKEKNAQALLEQMHWFGCIADFDPKTGAALPQSLSAFLAKVAQPEADGITRDRLWRITEHCRAAVGRLFHFLNESPRREHALLPVHRVRELDANSFIKLSNRSGRTIREKLADKPYMPAVRRFQSVDLPENRLLKAFVIRLAESLELRRDFLNQEDDLLPLIQSWLRSDEARDIGNWDNLPPNNTLLAHRDYRRVWDAWRWLQTLDDDIVRDFSQLETRDKIMRLWQQCANIWLNGRHIFAEMPLLFDYEKLEVLPWTNKPPLFKEAKQQPIRYLQLQDTLTPVCIDLTRLRPTYASAGKKAAHSLPTAFLWQQWKHENEAVDIELFNSDAAWLHSDATTISTPDLFFAKDNASDIFDRAARAFVTRLRDIFRNDVLVWLAPDFLNDFELEVIRRNINARFPDAKPLPRSMAAIFEKVDPTKITGEGYAVVVIDAISGKRTVTKAVAKFDKNLEKLLPTTRGFYWERCPPVIISSTDDEKRGTYGHEITTVDAQGQWHDAIRPVKHPPIDTAELKRDQRVRDFAFCINLTEAPVVGGIRLHALQQQAGNIPLWRDQIPELSIKVMKDEIRQRFDLVSRGTTVIPIRGKPVPISIDEEFTLPAGRPFYQFPLYMGDSAEDLGYSARLDSPAFPLKKDAVCDLKLTFEYGADEPYKLIFAPRDKSFPPIHTTWRRTEEIIITDAPAPEYPAPMTWADLRKMPKPNSNETSDLLEWVEAAIARIDSDLYISPRTRVVGVISSKWHTDKKGKHFAFATCATTDESVFIHESNFVHDLIVSDFSEGKNVSFELQERDGKYFGRKVAGPRYKEEKQPRDFDEESSKNLAGKIRKRLYFPVIQIWRDGRSIHDIGCPQEFSTKTAENIEYLSTLLRNSNVPVEVKNEIRFLFSCMHRDAPQDCVQWVSEQVEKNEIRHKQAVGFALGDVSEEWQKNIFLTLVGNPTIDVLRVFAYAIWREEYFIEKFDRAELQKILDRLSVMLNQISPCPPKKNQWMVSNWIRTTTELLELLLGLLRTRASSNPEIKMLLQPHQKITKELAKNVERVTELVVQSNIQLFSRVQINIQKTAGDCTPDLLYALRLYLTGDDGANAIHISSVSDNDNG